MHGRYQNIAISDIFSDRNKLGLWEGVELAVLKADAEVTGDEARISAFSEIAEIWLKNSIDIEWWKARDREIHHDYNAFLDERLRHLPVHLQAFVHPNITSYDGEEPAFASMLSSAIEFVVEALYAKLDETLANLAVKYRYTIMNARTHGQEAELQTFGARCLAWLKEIRVAHDALLTAKPNISYSKISGAIGKYGSINPDMEKAALQILELKPFYGATQIMPRILYAAVAEALCGLVLVIDKIATDIRLNARSGRPLMREPFAKKQKGSSAMPHKKNPIQLEQLEGMGRMAKGYVSMIVDNIKTWEERAIEQSCVERVAWPDLFHVTCHSILVLKNVLSGLVVYPDNMLREIRDSRGVYASSEAKEFLKERLVRYGFGYEDAYRIVQLACFNVFAPSDRWTVLRESLPGSYEKADEILYDVSFLKEESVGSIRESISLAELFYTDELEISMAQVDSYNVCLKDLFGDEKILEEWQKLFEPSFLLRHENTLYKEILGIE